MDKDLKISLHWLKETFEHFLFKKKQWTIWLYTVSDKNFSFLTFNTNPNIYVSLTLHPTMILSQIPTFEMAHYFYLTGIDGPATKSKI